MVTLLPDVIHADSDERLVADIVAELELERKKLSQFEALVDVKLHLGEALQERRLKLFLKDFCKLRIEYVAPELLRDQVLIITGRDKAYLYLPVHGQWREISLGGPGQFVKLYWPESDIIRLLQFKLDDYKINYLGNVVWSEDKGRPINMVELVPQVPDLKREVLWIDQQSRWPLRLEEYSQEGQLSAVVLFKDFQSFATAGLLFPAQWQIYDQFDQLVVELKFSALTFDSELPAGLFSVPDEVDKVHFY